MTDLSINLNRVALLRNSRPGSLPSIEHAARICIDAGANGITVHPRPDERHIRATDVDVLNGLITAHNASNMDQVEFNIEGYPSPEFLDRVIKISPHQCTLVPDLPDQATSDHGWDVNASEAILRASVTKLVDAGIRVSLFVDPEISVIDASKEIGADRIELYTEPYAEAFHGDGFEDSLAMYTHCAAHATQIGLGVNAGHDLNLANLPAFSKIPGLLECSIGHAVACDSIFVGLQEAVTLYRRAIAGESVAHDWYPASTRV